MNESDERKDFVFKITVIGDGGVGKTSLIKKYTKGSFKKEYINICNLITEKKLARYMKW